MKVNGTQGKSVIRTLIKKFLKCSVPEKAIVAFSEIERSVLETKSFHQQYDSFQTSNETNLFGNEIWTKMFIYNMIHFRPAMKPTFLAMKYERKVFIFNIIRFRSAIKPTFFGNEISCFIAKKIGFVADLKRTVL